MIKAFTPIAVSAALVVGAFTLVAGVNPAGKLTVRHTPVEGLNVTEGAALVQPPKQAKHAYMPVSVTGDGAYRLPFHNSVYSEDFDPSGWTILDINGDEEQWLPSESGWLIGYSEDGAMNDWLITPALNIKGSKSALVRLRISGAEDEYTDSLRLYLGQGTEAASMTTPLGEPIVITSSAWTEVTVPFTVEADGDYNVGLLCNSEADQGGLYVQDLRVEYLSPSTTDQAGVNNVPWCEHFVSQEAFDAWTPVQADGIDASAFAWSEIFGGMLEYQSGVGKRDDWIISPAVYLGAGHPYQVSFDVSQPNEGTTNPVEVCMGTAATAEAMTQTVLPRVLTPQQFEFATLQGDIFVPEKSGVYYFGIHVKDDEALYEGREMDIVNFTVSYVGNEDAPAAVTDVICNSKGRAVSITLTAPEKTIGGTTLTSLEKVELYRDGAFVTDDIPNPGDVIEMEDEAPEAGTFTYQIIPYNAEGQGLTYSIVKLVGFGAPLDATNVKMSEVEGEEGKVLLSWDAVTADVEGNTLAETDVTYAVINSRGEVLKDGLTDTEVILTFDATTPSVLQAGVRAFSKGGESNGVLADMISVGPAYEVPYKESFADGTAEKAMGTYGPGFAFAAIPSGYFQGFDAQDGDNGLFIAQCSQVSDGYLQSGKVTIPAEMTQPGLSFWANNVKTDNTNVCGVQVNDGTGWKTVLNSQVMGSNLSSTDGGWGKVLADLSAYKGKTITYRITFGVRRYVNIFFDNIRIEELPSKDLQLQSLTMPKAVKANSPFNIDVTVLNGGLKSVLSSKYKVFLYKDGQRLLGRAGVTLSKGAAKTFTFEQTMGVCEVGQHSYYAVIDYADDADLTNNTSAETAITVNAPSYPSVTLTAQKGEGISADLAWEAPNLSADPMDLIEGWENADDYAMKVDGWTFVDLDKNAVGGFNGIPLPGWTSGSSKGSYMVWPASVLAQIGMPAPEGQKALASIFCSGANNDWAISPQLTGEAQTVTFKAAASDYGDSFKAYYSTGSIDPADFVMVTDSTVVPNAWTEYTLTLPEGAKHFAIQNCSNDCFWILFDDFHFRGVNPFSSLQLTGYNVYRNGQKVGECAADAKAYADVDVAGKLAYNVAPVYAQGEGAASNTAEIGLFPAVVITGNAEGAAVTIQWQAPMFSNGQAVPVVGYDVYRDGQKLTAEPQTALSYVDDQLDAAQSRTYTVKAVYADGESDPSNELTVVPSGIDDLQAEGAAVTGRYDTLGRATGNQATGVVIERRADGTVTKRLDK